MLKTLLQLSDCKTFIHFIVAKPFPYRQVDETINPSPVHDASMPVTTADFEEIERLANELLGLIADYGRMLNTHP